MKLIFKGHDILAKQRALTFDDVLMVPRYSEIISRKNATLSTPVTKNYSIDIPIISANMDTITESKMACEMARLGGLGILHRFISLNDQIQEVNTVRSFIEKEKLKIPVAASIGVKEEGKERADKLVDNGVNILTVDIAHGDSMVLLEVVEYIKRKYPDVDVIAGNTATVEGTKRMIEAGADAVKVGIGPGSMCTTRLITGHGVPQLTAVALCASEANKYNVPVIADGGIKTSGDIVKALGVGASSAMIGSLLAGTLETPGKIKGGKKEYRGMASKAAQVSWRGEVPKGMAAEGVDVMTPCKGPVEEIVDELSGGIRSGMTYMGVDKIKDIEAAALFMEISPLGVRENGPHGLGNL